MLDPKVGRALIEGGRYLVQPAESLVMGTDIPGCDEYKRGTISVGGRVKIWVDDKMLSTSPIKSFEVKHNAGLADSIENISAALH